MHQRDALAFLNAEIHGVAQMVRVPIVPEDEKKIDAFAFHRFRQGALTGCERRRNHAWPHAVREDGTPACARQP